MSNTRSKGTVIDDVNRALDELNKYADQTIYNFTEMTRNIGTFTAAGVDLDTSVNAIKGIANLAAVSGSTSQQASTAMYQLSQAMASGTVKLMDWNSVVNAGMGGQVFQDALKETARVHGVNIDAMIEKEGSFRETLSNGWLTTEILTDTLQKFTLTTEGLTEAQIESNRQMLRAKGYTEDQIEAIFALGKDATDAATKVKTFTQLWDVLKESAQSGWSQTWKIIVGDYEEAKAIFTPLAEFMTGFINRMSDARNNFLKAVLYPWEAIKKKLDGSGLGKIKETVKSVTDLSKTLEHYQQVVHDVWMGKYKNSDTGRYGLLDAAGHDHKVIQDLVNLSDTYYKGQGYKYQLTIEDVQNSQRKFGVAVSESSETVVEMTEVLDNLTDEQLKNAGLTEEEIKLYRMLAEEAKRTGRPLEELIEQMSKVSGKTLLLNSLKNVGSMLAGVFKAIGTAWREIFDPPSVARTYTALESIQNFTKKLRLTEEGTGKLNENGKKLVRTFKGVFAIIDIITTVLGTGFKIVFKVVTAILKVFNINILDLTAFIGDALVKFRDWIDSLFDFEGMIKAIAPYVVRFGKAIKNAFVKAKKFIAPALKLLKEWFKEFRDSKLIPFLERLGKGLKNTFGKLGDLFGPAIKGVKNWFKSLRQSDNLAYDIVTGIAKGLVAGVKLIIKAIGILATDGWAGLKSMFGAKEGESAGGNIISGLAKGIRDGAKIVWDAMIDLAGTLLDKFCKVLGIHSPSKAFIAIGGFIVAGLLIGLKDKFPEVWETIKSFGQKCIDAIGGIDVGAVIALVTILGSLFIGNKLADALNNFSEPFEEFGQALERVSKGAKNYLNAKAFSEIAKAIAILVACVVVLTFIEPGKLWGAVGAVAVIAVILGALIGLIGFISAKQPTGKDIKSVLDFGKIALLLVGLGIAISFIASAMHKLAGLDEDAFKQAVTALGYIAVIIGALVFVTKYSGTGIAGAGKTFIGIAVAIGILAMVTKKLGELNPMVLDQGLDFILKFGFIIAGLMLATKLIGGGKNVDKIGGVILKISIAIGILAIIANKLGTVDRGAFRQGLDCVIQLGLVIAGLMLATKLVVGSKNVDKIGGAILKISVAIWLLAILAIVLSSVKRENLEKGLIAIGVFVGIIAALMFVTKMVGGKKGAGEIGKSILGVAGAIAVLALVAVLLGLVKTETLKRGIIALTALAIIVGVLIYLTKDVKKVKFGYLVALTGAILVLAGVVFALSFLEPSKLAGATAAMTILMSVFAVLIKVVSSLKAGKDWSKVAITIGVLAGVVVALGFVLYLLRNVKPGNAIGNVAALSVMLGVLTGLCALVLKMTKTFKANKTTLKSLYNILAVFGVLTLVVIGIAAAILIMKSVPFEQAISSAAALTVMLSVMTAVIEVLNKFPVNLGNVAKGAAGLLLLAIPLLAFVGILALMQNVDGAIANAVALSILATTLSLMLLPLTLVGTFVAQALLGVVGLLAMAVPLVAFVGILYLMEGVKSAEKNVKLICQLVVTLGTVLAVLAILGPLALIGVAALTALSALVIGMGVLVVAVGALFDACPTLEKFVDVGIPILEKLANGLGSVLGSFIDGFLTSALESLPEIGKKLSDFMANARPFIDGVKSVDDSVGKGVGCLVSAILGLSVANFLDGIVSLLPFCGDLADLGTDLSKFIKNAAPFIEGANTVNPECLKGIKALADAIMTLTAADLLNSLGEFLGGGFSMEQFGKDLKHLGSGIRNFLDGLGGLTDDEVSIASRAAKIVKTLAAASAEIPNTGGLLGDIVGNNDMGPWADQLTNVGNGIKNFILALTTDMTLDDATVEVASKAAKIVKTLASAASEIPNTGGLLGELVGNNDMGPWAEQMPKVAEGIKSFITTLTTGMTFDDAAVNVAIKGAEIVKTLASAAAEIPNTGGLLASITGDNDMESFAGKMPKLAEGVKGFLSALVADGAFGDDQIKTAKAGAEVVKALAGAAAEMPSTGGLWGLIAGDSDMEEFADQMPFLGKGVKGFADNIGTFSKKKLESVEAAISAVKALSKMTNDYDPDDDGKDFKSFGAGIVVLATKIKEFATELGKVVSTDIDDAIAKVNTVLNMVSTVTASDVEGLGRFSTSLKKLATDGIKGFVNEFVSDATGTDVTAAANKLIDFAIKPLQAKEQKEKFKTAGKDFGQGLINGINAKKQDVYDAAFALGQEAVRGEKDGQASNSPSKLTTQAGKWLGEGLIVGMKQIGGKVYDAGSVLGSTATDTISSAIANIAEAINADLDSEPTIRPVFDLTDLKSGAAAINGMLDGDRTLSVNTSTVGSLSASMAKLQNGNNSRELLSAINGLRKDVANNPRNTYSINGINVTEGSDVADAISTLVRAIKVEGRT